MSWVIVDSKTGEAVFETFKSETVDKITKYYRGYKAVPVLEYLVSLNRADKVGVKKPA